MVMLEVVKIMKCNDKLYLLSPYLSPHRLRSQLLTRKLFLFRFLSLKSHQNLLLRLTSSKVDLISSFFSSVSQNFLVILYEVFLILSAGTTY